MPAVACTVFEQVEQKVNEIVTNVRVSMIELDTRINARFAEMAVGREHELKVIESTFGDARRAAQDVNTKTSGGSVPNAGS